MATQRRPARPAIQHLATALLLGFLAGAFFVAALVWYYPNGVGRRLMANAGATGPRADRWTTGLDDAGSGVLETPAQPAGRAAPRDTTSNTGSLGPTIAPASPSIAPETPPAQELKNRRLEIPVAGVTANKLVRSFSDARSGGREHEALDILAPRNTPVVAVEDGAVARLFLSKAGGITIYQFDPTEQYCYYYAHLERYVDGLKEGDQLRKGQVIGYVGTSGNAPKDTPHLHFAVFRLTAAKHWWEGTPIDPYDVLR